MIKMKKIAFVATLLIPFTFHLSPLKAQAVVSDGFDRLVVSYKTPTPDMQTVIHNAAYTLPTLPGYNAGGEVGAPALPVRGDIIEVPFCTSISVSVENAVYDTIQLSKYTIFYPLQPSRSKSDTTHHNLIFDKKVYNADAFYGLPLAEVEVMGVARDRRLAQLRFNPVQINPVTNQVVVCRSADVTVTYVGSDVDCTLEHYQRYHTPAFSVGTTLNSLYSSNQAIKQSNNQVVRMVIAVPDILRCKAIERFAEWKRHQGLLVNILYYQVLGINTNTALAAHLKSFYDDASDSAPAPTYLLLVGDNNQLRAFDSQLPSSGYWSSDPGNDHITDLYFVSWTTGDDLPDCYQGRFSATDTATLASIVDKTLLYEQYAFADDSYLARAALVAGEDNASHTTSGWNADYAWVYADPTMDYIAYNYVNAANGYTDVVYYKNDTSYAPSGVSVTGYCSSSSSATALRNLYSSGLGWINYSAHGDWDCWHKPNFTISHVNSMNNTGKPSFMIGNCCLTNKFDKSICFGESLLRRGNSAGAVAYIGGTNSTYWQEDLYWSVGVRSNINHTLSPNYNAQRLGIYDRLFHTHSESFDKYAITAGAIVYYGNLSVNSSSSSSNMKKYYWEIYELMGDPSLMPWTRRAADLDISLALNGQTIAVTTVANAYVALVDTATLSPIFAAFADDNGRLSIDISSVADLSATLLSATAQNYKPYTRIFATNPLGVSDIEDSQLSIYPNPATDHVAIDGLAAGSTVELYDAQGRQISVFKTNTSKFEFDVSTLSPGLYLLRIHTPKSVVTRKLVKN